MKKRSIIFVSLIILAIIALIVLTMNESGTNRNAKIGSVLILTGDYKSYGEQFLEGMKLARQEINSNNKDTVDLIVYDSEGKKETALEKLKFLHERDGANFICEIMGTGLAKYCLNYINSNNMLVLSGVNTGAYFTLHHGPNFFRIIPSDGVASQQLAKWAIGSNLKDASIVYSDDDWGNGLANVLNDSYLKLGGKVISEDRVIQQQTMFQALVTKLKQESPQVVFLVTYPREAGLFLKEAHKQGFQSIFMGTDNFTGSELPAIAGPSIDSVRFVIPSASKDTSVIFRKFISIYKNSLGAAKSPSLFNIMGYDCLNLIFKVYEESKGDVNKAKSILANINYQGVSGNISFDSNHDVKVSDYARKIYIYNTRLHKAEIKDYHR